MENIQVAPTLISPMSCSLEKHISFYVRKPTVDKNNLASRELQHIITAYQKFLKRALLFKSSHFAINFLKWWLLVAQCQ